MKLVTDLFSSVFDFNEESISTLVIENPKLYRKFLIDIVNQIDGAEGSIILSHENQQLKFSTCVDLIGIPIPFEINSKKLLTKIQGVLEKEAINEQYYLQTMKLLAEIELLLDNLATVLPCELCYENLNPASLVKMSGIRILTDSSSVLENIIEYMRLVCELDREKIFIFLNIRSFFDDDEMNEFIKTIIAYKFQVLFIENCSKSKLELEHRVVIDSDLCEI